ncbi:MAG TPA: hypothetical protein ENN46_02840 [Candidatus Woesearchaeota archaeon]|nr:hypothetical protein [Candidatus Woesearchaeota archaeon]
MATTAIKTLGIVIALLLAIPLAFASQERLIDSKNAEILERLLELNGVKAEEISISGNTIFVSIEASGADSYDTELIAWWASIFANSALLRGYEKDYLFIVIENTVNKVPYAYVSVATVTVHDLMEGIINDLLFWDEVLITEKNPRERDIAEVSGLPSDLVYQSEGKRISSGFLTALLWVAIVVALAAGLFFLFKKNPDKAKKAFASVKKKSAEAGKAIKHASKKHGSKAAKSIAHHSKKLAHHVKDKSKKLSEKVTEQAKKLKEAKKQKENKPEPKAEEKKEESKDKG